MTATVFPKREANKLGQLWRLSRGLTFPIDAAALAQEWSRNVDPQAPISDVRATELKGFEGGLFWLKEKSSWALLYHPHPNVPGRSNFTIAHEFGHYVLHRKQRTTFQCSQSSTLGIANAQIEREADQFASYLLMPIDDFRTQVAGKHITLDLLGECAKRYGVSLTAALLKWIEFTELSAIAIMSREGMLHWWKGSDSAKRYARGTLREGTELPPNSLTINTRLAVTAAEYRLGISHAPGVWPLKPAVREMVVTSDRYDMAITLLVIDAGTEDHWNSPDLDMVSCPPRFGKPSYGNYGR